MPLTHADIHHAVDGRVETPVSFLKVSRGGGSMLLLLLSWWWVDVALIASYEIVELRAVDGTILNCYSTSDGTGMPLQHRFDGPRCDITMNL